MWNSNQILETAAVEFGGTNCLAVLVLPVRPSSVRPLHSIMTNGEFSLMNIDEQTMVFRIRWIFIDIVRILMGQLRAWRSRWNGVEHFAILLCGGTLL